jgi:AcrR family transcriptional regulator
MAKSSNPREQMIRTAVELMRERGVEATSFSEVLGRSGAPRGSIYYHFPGGKAQLIEEATRWAGAFIAAGERTAVEQGTAHAVSRLVDYWRNVLRTSDFEAGCPVAAVAVEGDQRPGARAAAAEAFATWEDIMVRCLRRDGVKPKRARTLATLVIAGVEGAVIIARAQRSLDALDRVGGQLKALVREATDARSRR